ncbi:MAG: hypothetical protein EXS18_04700 [Verrucomicrobiae bacterium]|nr:hypothetical protein [Verrucomicrobiae bacterium]
MRRYLIKPSPFLLFLIAPILDYPKVRRLSRRRQRTPWFVRVFEVLFLLTTLGMIASLVMYVVMRFKNST